MLVSETNIYMFFMITRVFFVSVSNTKYVSFGNEYRTFSSYIRTLSMDPDSFLIEIAVFSSR